MTSEPYSNWVIRMNNDARSQGRYQDVAYVLHGRAYQNSSMLVDLFTRAHGRIGLVAKGVKRPSSKMFGALQPLQRLFVSWGGRNELKTLFSAEIESHTSTALAGDRLFMGFYINELLIRLLHNEEAHIRLFDIYQQCLLTLASEADCEPALRYFEVQLLEELGYGVNFVYDYQTEREIQADESYIYVPERGFTQRTHQQVDELVIQGQTIKSLSAHQLTDAQQKKEAKLLLRTIIEYHLEGRPLKTRELFQQKQRNYEA
jgi:DNA repair protein RecO (recombination protein O)